MPITPPFRLLPKLLCREKLDGLYGSADTTGGRQAAPIAFISFPDPDAGGSVHADLSVRVLEDDPSLAAERARRNIEAALTQQAPDMIDCLRLFYCFHDKKGELASPTKLSES